MQRRLVLEGTLELKDPDHPQAVLAADATAWLLLEVHERRQQQAANLTSTTDETSESDEDE